MTNSKLPLEKLIKSMDNLEQLLKSMDKVYANDSPEVQIIAMLRLKNQALVACLQGVATGIHEGFDHGGSLETCTRESCKQIVQLIKITRI